MIALLKIKRIEIKIYSWQEFKSNVLKSGEVDKIVVINSSIAQVFLKANGSSDASESEVWDTDRGSTVKHGDDDKWNSSDSNSSSITGDGSSGNKGLFRLSRAKRLAFHFVIGNIESFEERMDEAQRDLGISEEHFIPIQYKSETNLLVRSFI